MERYRVIDQAEYDDIQSSGNLRCVKGMNEGKWFFEDVADMALWRAMLERLSGVAHPHCVVVHFRSDVEDRWYSVAKLDGIGPARFARPDQLLRLEFRLL